MDDTIINCLIYFSIKWGTQLLNLSMQLVRYPVTFLTCVHKFSPLIPDALTSATDRLVISK